MDGGGSTARFSTSGSSLSISGEIGFDDEELFTAALQKMMGEHPSPYTVNLTKVEFMSSSCIRIVAAAIVAAGKDTIKVRVVAKKKILRLFELAGIDRVSALELVEEA
jgi:anti-anti-sigma factor